MTTLNDYFKKRYYITPLGTSKYSQVDALSAIFTTAGTLEYVADSGKEGITLHELEHLSMEHPGYVKAALEEAIKKGYVREEPSG